VLWRCRLGGRKGIRPVKSWVVGCWSEVHTCIWTSWCHSLSLASVKSRLVLPFWQRLTRVVQDKGPLNGCVCVCAVTKCGISLVVNARLHCALSECMCISIYCTRQFLDCFGHVEWVVFVFFWLVTWTCVHLCRTENAFIQLFLCTFGARFAKYLYDLSSDCLKFIIRSTYDSDLKCARISLGNIVS